LTIKRIFPFQLVINVREKQAFRDVGSRLKG